MEQDLAALVTQATPGPWAVEGARHSGELKIGPNTRLHFVGPDGDAVAAVFFDMKTGQGLPDAKLIAMAPDLARKVLEQQAEIEAQAAEIARLRDAPRRPRRGMTGPERIWADEPDIFDGMGIWYASPKSEVVKNPATAYVRADIHDDVVKALREALIAAEDDLSEWLGCSDSLNKAGFNMDGTADVVAKARAALARTILPIDTAKQTV